MKIIFFLLLTSICFGSNLEINNENFQKYIFETNERTYHLEFSKKETIIELNNKEEYYFYLFSTNKYNGNFTKVYNTPKKLNFILSFLYSQKAKPILLYPIKKTEEDK
ncbi:MAG: hypothetical protein ACRCW9_06005 [Cetobacterium sp.]